MLEMLKILYISYACNNKNYKYVKNLIQWN